MSSEDSTNEDMRALAILYQKYEVPGVSRELESLLKAESNLLQLADQGDPEAMYDYAVTQHAKKNYEIAYKYFSRSGIEDSKKICSAMLAKGIVTLSSTFRTWDSM
jgi:TPR repeat protein